GPAGREGADATRRALRLASRARPAQAGGAAARGADRAVAVGGRGVHAPRLPLLPAASNHDLGRAPRSVMDLKAVVLISGGLDSSTALAVARSLGYECHALSFQYGQRHAREL